MKLKGGTEIYYVTLWNRYQWHYIRYPHNWLKWESYHTGWMITILGFHIWIFPPETWRDA